MERTEYIRRVLQAIDELHPSAQEDIAISYGVDRFLDDAVRDVLMIAPIHTIPFNLDFSLSDIEDLGDGSGRIKEPEGLLRLCQLKMNGWSRAVVQYITPLSDTYAKQFNVVSRGGASKPIVVREGGYFYYYSLPKSVEPEIETATAITDSYDIEDIPLSLSELVVWLTAYKILSVVGDANQSQIAYSHFTNTLALIN